MDLRRLPWVQAGERGKSYLFSATCQQREMFSLILNTFSSQECSNYTLTDSSTRTIIQQLSTKYVRTNAGKLGNALSGEMNAVSQFVSFNRSIST